MLEKQIWSFVPDIGTCVLWRKQSVFVKFHLQMFLLLLQVMMMVLPLLIIVLLPKVVNTNDPEMRKVNHTFKSLILRNVVLLPFFFSFFAPSGASLFVCHVLQEMEQSMNMLNPNPELPDVSELMTKLFSGSKGSSKASGSSSSKGSRPAVKRR